MKHITVHKIVVRPAEVYSNGIGFDDNGETVEFIGLTKTMENIDKDLQDFEDFPMNGRPRVYLEAWQIV